MSKRIPKLVVRKDSDGKLDDIVVEDVKTFRMEDMGDDNWWICCHLTNGEQIVWAVKGELSQTSMPPKYRNWDTGEIEYG